MKRNLIFLLATIFIAQVIQAQMPSGAWRDHLPYSHGKKLAEYHNRIYCLTTDGSLYSFGINDRDIKKHSKVNGLSDAEISTIGTSSVTSTLLIGYSNGNIDLVRNDSVINIPDIKRKSIIGGKSINNVYIRNNYAYLACDFGIVLCDLNRREIKETYYFGPGGTQIQVNAITSDGVEIIAATGQGIYHADINDPNLLDFSAWSKYQNLPDPDISYKYVVSYNSSLYTIYRNGTSSDAVIRFDESSWENWSQGFSSHYEFLGGQNGNLVLSTTDHTRIYSSQGTVSREIVSFYSQDVLVDSGNDLWYAALFGGLVKVDANGNSSAIAPSGPPYRDAGDIQALQGNVWVAGGTFKTKWTGNGAYLFVDEKWKEYNGNSIPDLKDFLNISEISIDPNDPGHVIGGSYGYGIAEFQDGRLVHIENESGGVLKPVQSYEGQTGYVRITGIDIDKEGNIYAVGSNALTAAYKKQPGQNWTAINLNYKGFGFQTNTGEILVTSTGQKWLALNNAGIVVFEDENGESTSEKSFNVKNQFGTVVDNVLCLAEDKDGTIWVGTNKGPVQYSDPSEIINSTANIEGYQYVIPRNDGTSSGDIMLSSEQVNDIAIDGGNRKWIATEKSGVFLISADGKKELLHFNEENSPLFSNSVQTIGINDKTGEVFFGTDKGIIAYNGSATEAGEDFGDVYVFPNPVRETYQGNITVSGLASDVNVKITDITGNLVYETAALGGQAVWDGRNFRGDRVQTGVYLVFCTNEDGTKTYVTKLLFIH
ncbi:MAG TPA: T9SS type A sorting domain-containing protein [Bacteroidales bacterium]|nr:T9SS type A sorting domain-containing protein [Bacteroidales bacterium]